MPLSYPSQWLETHTLLLNIGCARRINCFEWWSCMQNSKKALIESLAYQKGINSKKVTKTITTKNELISTIKVELNVHINYVLQLKKINLSNLVDFCGISLSAMLVQWNISRE